MTGTFLHNMFVVPLPCWIIRAFVVWAMLASPRKPSSGILAIMWIGCEVYSRETGRNVPLDMYFATDFIIFGAILIFAGRGWRDPLIAALLVVQLKCYVDLPENSPQQWWSLWVLASIQMIAAGPWGQVARQWSRLHACHPYSRPRGRFQHHPITLSGQF